MRILCEVMADDIFPGLRAMIAKSLTNEYNISQKEAAQLIGTTQPAVSQYTRSLRGNRMLENEIVINEVKKLTKDLYDKIITKDDLPKEFCRIGRLLIQNKLLDAYNCDIC